MHLALRDQEQEKYEYLMPSDVTQILHRMDNIDRQMTRFEEKLDDVQHAMVQMARTEERVAHVLEQNTELLKKITEHSNRLRVLEQDNVGQKKSLGAVERIGWLMITTAASVVAAFVTFFFRSAG